MIDINLNGALPTHVDRIKPKISVDSAGKINWTPGYLDYNASNYFPGKTVKSEEFNKHNLQHVYQGNYLMDVLQSVFDTHLPDSMNKLFRSTFGIKDSVVKTFTSLDWGEQQEDGYYYIDIPVSEHKFEPDETKENALERMNIDTEMYLLNSDGRFYEVQQVTVDTDNTVHIYTDDPTLAGFVVIRTNDKAIAVAQANFHISQVLGKAEVAETGKYADLVDLNRPDGTGPDDRITANAKGIASILSGIDDDNNVVKVAKALQADSATSAQSMPENGTLGGRVISNIFETGSNVVKKATSADIISDTSVTDDTVSFRVGTGSVYTKQINNVRNATTASQDLEGRSITQSITDLKLLLSALTNVQIVCTKVLPVTKSSNYGATKVTFTEGSTAEFSIHNAAGLTNVAELYAYILVSNAHRLATDVELSITDLATSLTNSKIIVTVTKGGSYTATGGNIPDYNIAVILQDKFGNTYMATDEEE